MKRLALILTAAALLALPTVSSAQAAFGFEDFDLVFTNADDSPATQAGSHPFAVTNTLSLNSAMDPKYGLVPEEALKDISVQLPAGLVGSPGAVPRCASSDFLNRDPAKNYPGCSDDSAVGVFDANVNYNSEPGAPGLDFEAAVFNLVPPPGVVEKLGFYIKSVPAAIEFRVNPEPPYNVIVSSKNISQLVPLLGAKLTLWGNPASPAHDSERGVCGIGRVGNCETNIAERAFITMPRSCEGPLSTHYEADSWPNPGVFSARGIVQTHDDAEPPNPQGLTGCGKLGFGPTISAKPTTKAAQSPTGLDFSLDVHDEGLTNPDGLAQSDIKKAVVTLPEGFSTNPSIAEGLNTCSETDLDRESVNSAPGAGCPNESKIGTIEVESPLVEEPLKGSLFIATPYENQAGSLIALYAVFRNPTLGIVVKQGLKVETDPVTGRLTTIADDIPQLPFSHFKLHFREGTRSPLASPPGCDADPSTPERDPYAASAVLTPWAGGAPITTSSAFEIISGPNAGPCPSGGTPPFHPDLSAGTINNAAGSYSPFNLRLSRNDGEQEFTHFSIKLPPGILAKLAGVPFCPDAAIAAAKARTGNHGGAEEIASPSCPAASEIGRTLVGVGVGPSLAYAPGKVYLAGPYNGSALSIAAITAGKVGPFDLGTVVVREGIKINPETAEVFIDATGSDPIPHIIKGIPIHARDIRVYVDKPQFTLNPTSCERTSTASTVLGSGLNFGSEADDQPVTVTSPFQAADCASLGFKPKLALNLKGASARGGHPRFKAVLTPRKGDANSAFAQVTLPHSVFLDTEHIKTICTRVQFNSGPYPGSNCPKASVYGYAKAITPLLDEPIQGPVFLRSSSHNLPDLVAALHSGKIDFNLVGRIDSVKGGRIRNTFESVPDAPVSKFTLEMQGAKKGLLVNSTDLCKSTNRAISHFEGQNGKVSDTSPELVPDCGKGRKGKKGKGKATRSALNRVLNTSW
jgi:hypothetical protein